MNIILVSNTMAKPKTLSIWSVVSLFVLLLVLTVFVTAKIFKVDSTPAEPVVAVMSPEQLEKSINSSQMHLDAYAKQIGQLQARIVRLDEQNKRLVKLASGENEEINKNIAKFEPLEKLPAASFGGPLINPRPMTEQDLQEAIAELASAVDNRDEYMGSVESDVLHHSVLKDMLPNSKPISAAYRSSSYGWRVDPFRGTKAFHEGLDFTARSGTPIRAAADGIVTKAGRASAYGNLIKLDHGAGLETRYAHASKLLVESGERVLKGQTIALVGSTGRSTGPHLHYEIRLNGHALDPRKYLNKK